MQEHPKEWLDFVAVISAQMVVLLGVMAISRPRARTVAKLLPFALAVGALVGAAFDLFVGRSNAVFSYHLPLSLWFGLLNGLLSYGVALLTAAVLPIDFRPVSVARNRVIVLVVMATAGAAACWTLWEHTFATAIGLGLIIIAVGELLLWRNRRTGPIFGLAAGAPTNFFRLWASSVLIGGAYEAANLLFPVWQWTLFPGRAPLLTAMSIIVGGYFVLFHALTTLSALFRPVVASQEAE